MRTEVSATSDLGNDFPCVRPQLLNHHAFDIDHHIAILSTLPGCLGIRQEEESLIELPPQMAGLTRLKGVTTRQGAQYCFLTPESRSETPNDCDTNSEGKGRIQVDNIA